MSADQRNECSRREFIARTAMTPAVVGVLSGLPEFRWPLVEAAPVRVSSPNGALEFRLMTGSDQRLAFEVLFHGRPVIDSSPLGITVDGTELAQAADVARVERYQGNRRYPWRGVHAEAFDRFNGARVSLRLEGRESAHILDIRAYDGGVAFRWIIPGQGSRVPDESTAFRLPSGSTVWYHDLRGHYEGSYAKKDIGAVAAGDWAGPPLTFQLDAGRGYASITEAGLFHYAGTALQAVGDRGFQLRLGHRHPASYPYTLRYGEENAARLAKAAAVVGPIETPWRVVIVGSTLDTLVNSDIVHNLAPEPDAKLFPKGFATEWVKPGRAVWKYLDGGGENTLETMKEFSRLAGELGFEYNLIEGFWQRWPESDLRDLVSYSRERKVGIWLWKHRKELEDADAREQFFAHAQAVGAVGVKLDFFDHEAKEVVELYEACLRGTAEHRLMVDFHGANKPTGESRTWPNEMTREAVSGMERRSMMTWSEHTTTIPFTRMLAGHLDFTPMLFGERRRETSWAHQIATAGLFTSPVLVYGAHPKSILENPAVEMIKSLPTVWDETRVLPFSEIGQVAAFVRRHGKDWFVIIANGPTARSVKVPVSFLDRRAYESLLVRDNLEDPAAVRIERSTMRRGDTVSIDLRAGGGFLARFS